MTNSPNSSSRRPPALPSAGRIALGMTFAMIITSLGAFTAMCAGLEVGLNLIFQPAVALFAGFFAVLFALPYLFIILWLDRNEREPWYLIVSALVWGAVLATGLSGIYNGIFGGIVGMWVSDPELASQLGASFSAPFIEELTKGAALAMLYFFFRREFDNVLDGVVYGALVGLGFAVFENFSYYVNQEGGVAGVFLLTYIRGFVCALGGSHATFTALTGLGLGLFRTMRSGWLRWIFPPLGLAAAMTMHFCWNTFAGMIMGITPGGDIADLLIGLPAAVVVIQLPFLLFVAITAFLALRHEKKIINQFLSTESSPVIHADELGRLIPAYRRSWRSLTLFATLNWAEWLRTRRRNHLLVRLAFEKWHQDGELHSNDQKRADEHGYNVDQLRKQLSATYQE